MELELKILREKVTEDEKKSGIGSLYDDDKTSHQHIQLLKTKYAQMRREFDRHMQELQKQALKVKGQEFVLAAQISIMKEQNTKLSMQQKEYKEETDKRQFDLDKDLKVHFTFPSREMAKEDEEKFVTTLQFFVEVVGSLGAFIDFCLQTYMYQMIDF